jgi:site-specific recombinase XerC
MAQGAQFSYQTLTRFVCRNRFGNAKSSVTRSITTAQQRLTKIVYGARSLRILNTERNFVLVGIMSCGFEVGSDGADESIELGCPRDWNLTKFSAFWRCDSRTRNGRRDVAVLPVLVRLGMRVGEAALQLDDLDWHAGEIVVRGKGKCTERLPLPSNLGISCVALRPIAERRGFLLSIVPARGLRDCARQQRRG